MPLVSDWTRRVYTAVDARDADAFVKFLDDDVWVRFGNAPPVVGRAAVRASFVEFFARIADMHHAFTGEWRGREASTAGDVDVVLLEADVTYTRLDGRDVTIPAFTVFRLAPSAPASMESLATRVQIFMDVSPVFAPTEMPALCRDEDIAVDEVAVERLPASDPPARAPSRGGAVTASNG